MVASYLNGVPAVDVQQNASPATHDEPTVPNTPARGKDMRRPILVGYWRLGREWREGACGEDGSIGERDRRVGVGSVERSLDDISHGCCHSQVTVTADLVLSLRKQRFRFYDETNPSVLIWYINIIVKLSTRR